jgi:hypothetical protein
MVLNIEHSGIAGKYYTVYELSKKNGEVMEKLGERVCVEFEVKKKESCIVEEE